MTSPPARILSPTRPRSASTSRTLSPETVAALHVRRAGWLSAQQLGMYLLEEARAHGVELVRARVKGVGLNGGRVSGVQLAEAPGGSELASASVATPGFVNAAGPLCPQVARLVGVELPVFAELHAKVAFHDTRRAVPRHAPLLIWTDPQQLEWSDEETAAWGEGEDTRWLLEELPGGAHTRPDGPRDSDVVVMLWAYHTPPAETRWPPDFDPCYAEVTLRGLASMLPTLQSYAGHLPRPVVDGGYYLKTRENRPLIGPAGPTGAYLIGGLSGFGLMASSAAGELLAAHAVGARLPAYAEGFRLERYDNPAYLARLAAQEARGQL